MAASPYPPVDRWQVPAAAVAATLEGVADGGRRDVEAGVFWLGARAATSSVEAVVLLRGRGVLEAEGLWQVDPEVYGHVSRWARARGVVLLGTAHIHGFGVPVRLSLLDRRHLVRAPDVLALVIGEAGTASDPMRWSWNVWRDGEFLLLGPADVADRVSFTTSSVGLARADADGLYAWEPM